MFIEDKYLEIYNSPEVEEYLKELRQCVKPEDLNKFEELIIPYGQLIQGLTLQIKM